MGGPGPSAKYLRKLNRNQRAQFKHTLAGQQESPSESRVFISRAGMRRGVIAGESAIEAFLTANGFQIVRPEIISLREQLAIYNKAALLLCFEGSAVHALQLLGKISAKVFVFPRMPGHRIAEAHLRPRVSLLDYIDVIGKEIVPEDKAGGRLTWEGLTFIDWTGFFKKLSSRVRLEACNDNLFADLFHVAEALDLELWTKEMQRLERLLPNDRLCELSTFLSATKRSKSLHVLQSFMDTSQRIGS